MLGLYVISRTNKNLSEERFALSFYRRYQEAAEVNKNYKLIIIREHCVQYNDT